MKRPFDVLPKPGALVVQLRLLAANRELIKALATELTDQDLIALRSAAWAIYFPLNFELEMRRQRVQRERRKMERRHAAAHNAALKQTSSSNGGSDVD
jgi:hypothetical protein